MSKEEKKEDNIVKIIGIIVGIIAFIIICICLVYFYRLNRPHFS